MGTKVLDVAVSDSSHDVRGYAHCSASTISPLVQGVTPKAGQVTLLLLNLNSGNATIVLPRALSASSYVEYQLTQGSQGVGGPSVLLNGDLLSYTTMKLPTLSGKAESAALQLQLAPQSIGFYVFDASFAACN